MCKRYETVTDQVMLPDGRVVDVLRVALVDYAMGDEGYCLDLAGVPHDSEAEAVEADLVGQVH